MSYNISIDMISDGFVYIWYDRSVKRFYIGSHRGTIDDGYICSSKVMMNAYRKRPQHFKRRILKFCSYDQLLVVEQQYLNLIKDSELFYRGKKYYNIKRTASGGDTTANHPLRDVLIKKRYGKKHSDGIRLAIKNRSAEKKVIQIQRRRYTLKQIYDAETYTNYQDKPFTVYVNGQLYKTYRNKLQCSRDLKCDVACLRASINTGTWIIKQKRKGRDFNVGDVLTFSLT